VQELRRHVVVSIAAIRDDLQAPASRQHFRPLQPSNFLKLFAHLTGAVAQVAVLWARTTSVLSCTLWVFAACGIAHRSDQSTCQRCRENGRIIEWQRTVGQAEQQPATEVAQRGCNSLSKNGCRPCWRWQPHGWACCIDSGSRRGFCCRWRCCRRVCICGMGAARAADERGTAAQW
jgi:hypothetical protein